MGGNSSSGDVIEKPASGARSFPRLRAAVEVCAQAGATRLIDGVTGFEVELPAEIEPLLSTFGASREDVRGAPDALDELVSQLSALGLLDEGLDDAEIRRRQRRAQADARDDERLEELREALVDAGARVPFHRERFAAAGFDPSEMAAATELSRVPVMTKDDVRAGFPHALLAGDVDLGALLESGEVVVGATSGTTDERLSVLSISGAGALRDDAPELLGLDLGPGERLARGAVFTTPLCSAAECHLGSSSFEERLRDVTLVLNSSTDIMAIRDDEVRNIAEEWQRHEPSVVFVHPWYATWLGLRLAALGLSVPPPRAILSSYQMLTRRHRRLLQELFGAPAFSYYSATELGGYMIGMECHRGRMHVREDDVFLEVQRDDAAFGSSSALGDLLVTTLRNRFMPLVRYRVGDVGRLLDEACDCDFGPAWRSMEVYGRRKDLVWTPAGRCVTTREIDDAVGDADVDFYRFSQVGREAYRLEAMPAKTNGAQRAADRLSTLLEGARVDVEEVARFSPERSLKFRQTFSLVGPPTASASDVD